MYVVFLLSAVLVTQVTLYMGFTLGSAHAQVAPRHALIIHGRCLPMSQSTVNNRQATCV